MNNFYPRAEKPWNFCVNMASPPANARGDSILAIAHRIYLKLDTQGFDLEVLRGGAEAMRSVVAVQSEISMRPIYEGMPTADAAILAFRQHGFVVADYFLVSADHANRAIEFDCIMARE